MIKKNVLSKTKKARRNGKYISLTDCERFVRSTLTGHRLDDYARHIIGVMWAHYIDKIVFKEIL